MYMLALLSSVLLATSVEAGPTRRALKAEIANPKALYFITNGANNQVASLGLDASGKITNGVHTNTGGQGQAAFFGKNGSVSAPDSLFSQSPITVAGNMLFAVNAGSNDMSAFAINQNDPTQLKLLGKPVKVPGTFPNTVSASTINNLVCVGMSGSKAGLSCAKFNPKKAAQGKAAVGAFDTLRPFNLAQSDPPVGPQNTLSQVLFVSDQDAIRAFVKGSGNKNSKGLANGFVAQFALDEKSGKVSQKATNTPASPGAQLFGTVDLPKRNGVERVMTSDSSLGVRVFHFNEDGGAVQDAALNLGNAGTPFGSAFSKFTQKGYVSDVDNNQLVEVDFDLAQVSRKFKNGDANNGFTDMVAGGKFVYALNPGTPANKNGAQNTAVTQFDVSGQKIKEVKTFTINSQGLTAGKPAGMAGLF